ncbi:hypothetical protein QWY79_10140 [Halomonas sabkhae]|uniref:phage tail fiber protein n=1 Tax=Halomonas sabkhae TaxID=626223 RepID=UPI0025B4615E|nr:hypothetical protein [Halomonas sabkhae]MDN3525623.1 hypothetical protein [Halomonas sabkhae]
MAYDTVDQANQHTIETLEELERRARDLVNILKGGIDVGQSGTLGDLALLDNATQIPKFANASRSEMQKFGVGAGGDSAVSPPIINDASADVTSPSGLYKYPTDTPGLAGAGVIIRGYWNANQFVDIAVQHSSGSERGQMRTRAYQNDELTPWRKHWDTGNATVDSNGFIKRASPIFRLGSTAEDGQHKLAGAGAANDEARGVSAEHVETGIYRVSGALGFAAEDWRAELPRGGDGSKLCLIETETSADGTITVRVYSIVTDPLGNRVAHELIDVPDGAFVTLRLLMPTTKTIDEEGNEIEVETTAEPQADITVDHLRSATYKLDVWDRMTDDEAEVFETEFGNVGAKLRGMWRDCRYVDHDSPLFSTLRGMIVEQWGETRADELLAPSL